MAELLNNPAQLARLLEAGVANGPPPAGPPPGDDEIELLLGGQLDSLPEADQRRILAHVAADPELAALVAEMHALAPAESDAALAEQPIQPAQPAQAAQPEPLAHPRAGPTMRYGRLAFFTRCAFAVAACLTLGLGVWRLVDPPPAEQQNQFQTMGTNPGQTGTGKTDYWQQVQQRREGERAPLPSASMHPRDYALIFVGVACLILAIPVAYWAISITAVAARRSRPPSY